MERRAPDGGQRTRIRPSMSRVLVAEKIAPAGLDRLRRAGHEVVDLADVSRERLLVELATADALLVRSATKVDAALFAAAILANDHIEVRIALDAFRSAQTAAVLGKPDPRQP